MNALSQAGVFAEDMLFATLDPTTRKIQLPRINSSSKQQEFATEAEDEATIQYSNKGQEILLTDTVGFISKLPTDLIAAFR